VSLFHTPEFVTTPALDAAVLTGVAEVVDAEARRAAWTSSARPTRWA
jgi:hypothetical protein